MDRVPPDPLVLLRRPRSLVVLPRRHSSSFRQDSSLPSHATRGNA